MTWYLLLLFPSFFSEFCVCLVTVQSRNGPIRNSVLPNHLTDLANYIQLESRLVVCIIISFFAFSASTNSMYIHMQKHTLITQTQTHMYRYVQNIIMQNSTHKLTNTNTNKYKYVYRHTHKRTCNVHTYPHEHT